MRRQHKEHSVQLRKTQLQSLRMKRELRDHLALTKPHILQVRELGTQREGARSPPLSSVHLPTVVPPWTTYYLPQILTVKGGLGRPDLGAERGEDSATCRICKIQS